MSMGDPASVCHTRGHLRQQYIRILQLLLRFQTENGFGLSADSAEFYKFVKKNGLSDISQEKLKSAVHFMEESFQKTVREKGKKADFINSYLAERFQLAKQIWGPHDEDEGNDDQMADEEHRDDQLVMRENVTDIEYDDAVEDEDQDFMDLAILKSIICFNLDNKLWPEPDSDELYNFIVRQSIKNIPQDLLVDRILLLEEHYSIIDTRIMLDEAITFRNRRRKEIYRLSRKIWADAFEYSSEDEDDQQDQAKADEQQDQDYNEQRDILDVTILRAMLSFMRFNRYTPKADNKQLYNLVVEFKIRVTQEKMVARLLFLEGNFRQMKEYLVTDFRDLRHREIYVLSKIIWGGEPQGS